MPQVRLAAGTAEGALLGTARSFSLTRAHRQSLPPRLCREVILTSPFQSLRTASPIYIRWGHDLCYGTQGSPRRRGMEPPRAQLGTSPRACSWKGR